MKRIPEGTRVVVTTNMRLLTETGLDSRFAGKECIIQEDDGSDDDSDGLPYRLSAPTDAPEFTQYWAYSGLLTVQDENRRGPYSSLERVYSLAVEQAGSGKGAERHVNQAGEPFEDQLIVEIGRRQGNTGFQIGQAVKKSYEASGMLNRGEKGPAKRELLGAMNYLAAAYIMIGED
jgi:hypothetical protein